MNRRAFVFLRRCAGFTLVEMIVVIVLTGIVAGMVAVFIRSPVQAYVDTANRARLTEAADTAMRFFARDLRSALPNSVRVTAPDINGVQYLEFVPTVGVARYRQYPPAVGVGDILDFNTADNSFDILGTVPAYNATHSVVVFNTDADSGNPDTVYSGGNRTTVTAAGGANVAIAARRFPAPSPSARVHFVTTPVTYECNPSPGVRQLRRYGGYPFAAGQPTPPNVVPNILANNVTACLITYNAAVSAVRTGLLVISLTLTINNESVNLVHQVHVQNMP